MVLQVRSVKVLLYVYIERVAVPYQCPQASLSIAHVMKKCNLTFCSCQKEPFVGVVDIYGLMLRHRFRKYCKDVRKENTIEREILEEVGYKTDKLTQIDERYMSPGGSTEIISIFYAEVSEKIDNGGGLVEESEEIKVIEMDLEQLRHFSSRDAKTIIAINYVKNNKNLFM